jgi:hypothetical protein
MNPGPPGPCLLRRELPGRTERREPTLVRDVDLGEPLPDLPGGAVTRAWLLMRVGGVAVGELLVAVPENGLRSAEVGVAIAGRLGAGRLGAGRLGAGRLGAGRLGAGRLGAGRRRPAPEQLDRQLRERSRGRISSE